MTEIKVGDVFWKFDLNRRVYDKEKVGGPIYREHFYQVEITGETSKSWIVNGQKIPKSNPFASGKLYTDEMKENKIWENSHRYNISRLVGHCSIDDLKSIADLLKYSGDKE